LSIAQRMRGPVPQEFSHPRFSEDFLWQSKQSSGSASRLCGHFRKDPLGEMPQSQPTVPNWGWSCRTSKVTIWKIPDSEPRNQIFIEDSP
jgi:hypothetical protein